MLYLVDANVLISAHELHYPLDRIPQFWTWVLLKANEGSLKLPHEIYNEISVSTGDLKNWITISANRNALCLNEQIDPVVLQRVTEEGYAPDLTDSEIDQIGRDPFLVAYALQVGTGVSVVTREVSRPSKTRQNRKVPDVCAQFGVRCIDDFQMFRELDFRIVG